MFFHYSLFSAYRETYGSITCISVVKPEGHWGPPLDKYGKPMDMMERNELVCPHPIQSISMLLQEN